MRKILTLVPIIVVTCSACGSDGNDGLTGPSNRVYDCSVFPAAAASPYILPWRIGTTREANPHAAREAGAQEYSLDIPMPIGTEIVAIRDGTVVGVRENFFDGDNVFGRENYIFVQHDDGTMARYIHLTNNGALLEAGDFALRGNVIARSGNTGNSTGPHLHFDVVASNAVPPDYSLNPSSQTIPLNFRNATASNGTMSCGLQRGVFYTAEVF